MSTNEPKAEVNSIHLEHAGMNTIPKGNISVLGQDPEPAVLSWSVAGRDVSERSRHAAWCNPVEESKPVRYWSTTLSTDQPPSTAQDDDESTEQGNYVDLPPLPPHTINGVDSNVRPRKRGRLEVIVELPTLGQVYGRKPAVVKSERESPPLPDFKGNFEDAKVKGSLRNPKVKIKKDSELSLDSVIPRLLRAGIDPHMPMPVDIDLDIRDLTFPREFISKLYGGNPQQTFPVISKKHIDRHGLNDFVFLNPIYNPHVAQIVGGPGLFFEANSSPAFPWPKIQRVIIRLDPSHWLYLGQYQLIPEASLTKEEWLPQKPQTKHRWAHKIRWCDWGRIFRSRITFRRQHGREPTSEEQQTRLDSKQKFDGVTEEEIRSAMDEGLEYLTVWCMKCVGYDSDFQRNLAAEYPAWEERQKQDEKTGETAVSGRKAGENSAIQANEPTSPRKKRKLATEDDHIPESDYAPRSELVYRPRGTRSRPMIID
ncbi:hypothetical protein HGRIS_013424 [Hohenbuehelia grisea]|uniref:DUF6697 domain-containing protein n=1 Tax=Hohenbuehelia grisea TaxID=104357 RepID=A0ABR3IVH2_9AGAR